ncbi:porphobilinogen synthase [Flavobacteriaceae bacterium]|nr:porphobilinogen synthase [Flavobacteriaceae bacterium]
MTQFSRLRRNRKYHWLRDLLAETTLHPADFVLPFFVIEGQNKKEKIDLIPGHFRFSIDLLIDEIQKAADIGIKAIIIFPKITANLKDANGSEAINEKNLVCRTIAAIKKNVPEIGIISDVALDPYTSHGHDGLVNNVGEVQNDETVEVLCKQALVQAKAGCDIVSPSDMMDGRILKIRQYLDKNGFQDIPILSYAIKYASNFYGAFRDAVNSGQRKPIDKKSYQMDFRNYIEAKRESKADIAEGADMMIIKPAGSYLDIIAQTRANCNLPIFAYQTSGEYAMLKFGAQKELFDFEAALFESLIAIKRAGSEVIISYGAMEIIKHLSN